jgi:isopentenyl-diphosphate delta-isomerase
MPEVTPTSKRKADHVRINLEEDVASALTTGLERLRFEHQALPELHLDRVDTTTTFLGRRLRAPVLISSMTGGTDAARRINAALAEAAQSHGVAMGRGSQRAAVEDAGLAATFQVRHLAPDILLLANLGAVQLNYGYGVDECRRAVEMVEADGLILHLNPLQEALQPEGQVDFADLLRKIALICKALPGPVIVKEVGWGISAGTARRLVDAGVAAIDVAGAGGTSWSQVEMHRAQDPLAARLPASFVDWGIPTADAVAAVRGALPDLPLIASGGLSHGIDIAKCLALGADLGGLAGPFLRAAAESPQAAHQAVGLTVRQLRISMFAAGAPDVAALRKLKLHHAP